MNSRNHKKHRPIRKNGSPRLAQTSKFSTVDLLVLAQHFRDDEQTARELVLR